MSKIGERFESLLSQGKKAFIPFFTAFYPSREQFRELLLRADEAGVDFVETGLPFSHPLADGRTIQHSSQCVLKNGFALSSFFEELESIKGRMNAPLIIMSYLNPILQRGLKTFASEAEQANVQGLIVPNLPFEESSLIRDILASHDIDLIYLIAPTTGEQRIKKISTHSRGFIYLVSLKGVTGMRDKISDNLAAYIKRVRKITSKPLCVGFGISRPDQAGEVAAFSDGVIIGSALINLMKGREKERELPRKVANLLRKFRRSIP